MQRFFVKPHQIDEAAHQIHITGTDVNHIANVLRMRQGEELWISDGEKKEYHCVIEALGEEEILLHILYAQEPDYELPSRIFLFQGLPKGDKMELIIHTAVQRGDYYIIPGDINRGGARLKKKKPKKTTARWQQIAESAAKQSKRMLVPRVHPVLSYKEALAYAGQLDVLLIPYELAGGMDETKKIIGNIKGGQSLGIFIGPEGGFEEEEVKMAVEKGASPITLGKRILRTETAGMAILSVLMFQLERGE